MRPREFMGFVNRCARGNHFDLGRIDIMNNFSFFEVPHDQVKAIIKVLDGNEYDGRYVNVEVTENNGNSQGSSSSSRKRKEKTEKEFIPAEPEKKKKKKTAKADPMAKVRKKNSNSKPEWAQFFEGQVEEQPFFSIFSKKGKKKRK